MWIWHLVVVIVLQLGDLFSTLWCLSLGGKEANPLMARFVSRRPLFIAVKLAGVAFILWMLYRMGLRGDPHFDDLTALHHGVYAFVVFTNIQCALELRRHGPCTCRRD